MQKERVLFFPTSSFFNIVIELLRADICQLLSKQIKTSPLLVLKLNLRIL